MDSASEWGALRITLLFGSAAVALALIAAPLLEGRSADRLAGGVDTMSTGSIAARPAYTDPQERAAVVAGRGLHHPLRRRAQRRLLSRRAASPPVKPAALTFLNRLTVG